MNAMDALTVTTTDISQLPLFQDFRMVPNTADARETAWMWLARFDRGLQAVEVQSLHQYLRDPVHRNVIFDMAKLWHDPAIIGLLSKLFPTAPAPMESTASPKRASWLPRR